MDVRAQIGAVFHLDKCIGCHTCSIACKNIWTDRKGLEYAWWNNVETKPGTGYPTLWEDQEKYKGGWELAGGELRLKLGGKISRLVNLFYNPYLPTIDDYYEPWTYRYEDLFNSPEMDVQPVARPISMITGEPIEIEAGPNWDDDLSGTPVYARNDPNLRNLSEEEKQKLFEFERVVFFYVPRICNHCLNPGCVAACPAGAIYKRAEDGIVLISQEKCRAWRMCISGCPYKKVYFNWNTGKSEKCILCYPRVETGMAPACFHSCVGRIRYLGVILYDADRIVEAAKKSDRDLVDAQREIILDPFDEEVIKAAKANGIHDSVIEYAQKSPVYKFVKEWKIAFPLHPEYRTMPMVFYVPPLLPVMAFKSGEIYELAKDFFSTPESVRVPVRYLSNLFTAGNEDHIVYALKKMLALRLYKRAQNAKDVPEEEVKRMMDEMELTPEVAEEMYRLMSLPTFHERFVIPPSHRELSVERTADVYDTKASTGFGFRKPPQRGM
ncbi:MAG TPA: nitrate reductase subunit beta [Aquifex aeolicus]|uniref:Nitrate reductase subunit beta n=1 Tax=Aquifex aeolicus TaxID=63363 RepID=A0A7C5L9X0_AQUAO|nr:nitrate reductase subunit beta [Aquifex aeolicus]